MLSTPLGHTLQRDQNYVRTHGHTFDFGVWVANVQVVEEEHAVKGLSEELYLRLLVNWPRSLH
jgi:hypothetical protein